MKKLALLILAASIPAMAQSPFINPKYFVGSVAAFDPSASPKISGSAYYGYQIANSAYMVSRTDFNVSVKNGVSVTCAQAGVYSIPYQNKYFAVAISGNGGIATNGTNVGGCIGAEGGVVVPIHTFNNGVGWKLTAGYRDEKSSLGPNSKGIVFGTIFTID